MALIARGASYTYGKGSEFQQPAVASVDVALDVDDGPLLVAGRTGSGKSTLLRLLSGLLVPDSGNVDADGCAVADSGPAPSGIGLVFQSPESQLFAESVLADVMFGPLNLGAADDDARATAEAALESVGLDPCEFGERSPFSLSGGEARRVAIAGVLAMKPRYLLLDEPLAGLDAEGRALILDLIKRVSDKAAVAVVSHDIEEVLGVCRRVLVLEGGRTAFLGDTTRLLADPDPLTAAGLAVPALLALRSAAAQRGVDLTDVVLDPIAIADAIRLSRGGVV